MQILETFGYGIQMVLLFEMVEFQRNSEEQRRYRPRQATTVILVRRV